MNREPEVPVNDYNLSFLKAISVRGFRYYVMPRYVEHYVYHDYESFSADLFEYFARTANTIVDVGAHFGFYSLIAKRANPEAEVVAFEPVPETRRVLNKNAKVNKLTIEVRNEVIGNKEKKVSFNIPWASDSAGLYEHPKASSIKKIEAYMTTIDKSIKTEIDLLKVDTEGNEIEVLNGARDTIMTSPNIKLFVEFNPATLRSAKHDPKELLETIDSLGLSIFSIEEEKRLYRKIDPSKFYDWRDFVAEDEYVNLLCVPKKTGLMLVVISHSSQLGGAEMAMVEYLDALKKRGALPIVILPNEGPILQHIQRLSIPYQIIPYVSWARGHFLEKIDRENEDYTNIRAIQRITNLIHVTNPDLIISNTIVVPWGAVAASAAQKPHIWYIHEFGNKDHELKFDYPYSVILHIINVLSHVVIANSKAVAEHLKQGVDSGKIRQLYHSISPPEKVKPVKNLYRDEQALKCMVVGKLTRTKGQQEALEALKKLITKKRNVELVLLGQQDDKEFVNELKSEIKKNHLEERIQIIGFKENKYDYIAAADVLLMCSKNEAFGRITVEGMLMGKPVIGTNSGGTPEIVVDRVTGFLYSPGNVYELVEKIDTFIKKPKLLNKMGSIAKKVAMDRFGSTQAYDMLYNTLDFVKDLPVTNTEMLYEKILNIAAKIEKDYQQKINTLSQELESKRTQNKELKHQLSELSISLERILKNPVIRLGIKVKHVLHKPRKSQ